MGSNLGEISREDSKERRENILILQILGERVR
jgi:hypothetical protein